MYEEINDLEVFTKKDWLYFGIAILFLTLELCFMWDWCRWVTNCY